MLVKVLDVVASWGAILLLDEADVYLERRPPKDLARNAMTGVFLRHLEYYCGVLFLIPNRDSSFDEAICSRITMFLYYGRHDEQQRSTIWTNMFRRVRLEDHTPEDLAEFSKPDFNGREIRKIMKTTQTLAKEEITISACKRILDSVRGGFQAPDFIKSNSRGHWASLPTHQHPNDTPLKLQGECSNSAFADPTPSELMIHPSSTLEIKLDDECPPESTTLSSCSSQANSLNVF